MHDELRLPFVRRAIARFSERDWVALDIALVCLVGGLSVGAVAMQTGFRFHGIGWDVVRFAAVGTAALVVPFRRAYPVGSLAGLVIAGAIADPHTHSGRTARSELTIVKSGSFSPTE